jgi:hypothetical protein
MSYKTRISSLENLRASRLRTVVTVAAAGAILVTGLNAAPDAGAEETTVGPPSRGPYTPCHVDGETFGNGTPVGSAPLRWKDPRGTPYAGARYDRCANTVTFYYGGYTNPSYYKVKWTLSPKGTTTTYDTSAAGSRKKTLTATHTSGYTTYTVQVKACSGTLCTRWSPIVYLTYLR